MQNSLFTGLEIRSKIPHVGFAGYAGAGKTEAAKVPVQLGFTPHNFSSLIKVQINPMVKENLGFSAFTEIKEQKELIRPLMEMWGEINYDNIFTEYFQQLPERSVNDRITKLKEAEAWRRRGGIIVWVERIDSGQVYPPSTMWEEEVYKDLKRSGLITHYVENEVGVKGSGGSTLQKQLEDILN